MRSGTASIEVDATSEDAFDLIHDYSRRLDWDPFLRQADLLNGANQADVHVTSRCVARWAVGGLGMETEYVSFRRPTVAAVKMTKGPFFLRTFAASIRHEPLGDSVSRVIYQYNFAAFPVWLRFLIEPIVHWIFQRETVSRLRALKDHLEHSHP